MQSSPNLLVTDKDTLTVTNSYSGTTQKIELVQKNDNQKSLELIRTCESKTQPCVYTSSDPLESFTVLVVGIGLAEKHVTEAATIPYEG